VNSPSLLVSGSARQSNASAKLKIVVFAPMPSASVSPAISVKPGFFTNIRAP
jgi:hypothetical protein